MAKKVLAVVLDKEGRRTAPEVAARLTSEYGESNVHAFAGGVTFVAVPGGATTQTAAQVAGIKGKDRITSGVVFKLNSAYSGYTSKALWEWLSEAEGSG